ncbi:MAG: S9 family peptidase [Bacteroidales bacterium]|nr:S9 family peptidase [Bacteroidales bacterium]
MKSKLINLIAIALLIANVSCTSEKKEKIKEPLKIDVSLTQNEISKGLLTPEIMWKFGRVDNPCLSPDGKMLTFTTTYYNLQENKGITHLYVVPTEGGEPKKLTNGVGSEYNPQWGSDGKTIRFISTESGNSKLWEVKTDGTGLHQISGIEGDIDGFCISPDGTKILYSKAVKLEKLSLDIHPDMNKANVRIIDNLMYRHWNYWEDGAYSHIFVANLKDGTIQNPKDINEGEKWDTPMATDFEINEVQWSPDGKKIVYCSKKLYGKDYAVSTNSDIYVYDLESGKTEDITSDNMGYDRHPSYSSDGQYIAWCSMATPGNEADQRRLFIVNIKTGQKTYLTQGFDQNVDQYVWSEDNKSIYFSSGVKGTKQLYKINIETKGITQITKGTHDYTLCQKQGGVLIGEKMSMSMAPEFFKVDEATGAETQITFTNKNIYDNIKMAEVQGRWVKTTDGKDMLVWVILPPNFDKTKKYPTLLYCQGGPQSTVSQFWSYRWNFQIMAANGYVIVAPNRRGVPSFGQAWNAQISGDYSGQNIKDYLSAIDDVRKESWVNNDKLGCVGASYGGYSVFYLAGHHQKRFKAFIAHCGMYNLESFYGATEETFFPNNDLGGPFWDKNNKIAQKSFENSPHKFIQNWDTPIMIITGERDYRIPYTESLQAFNAAQLRGIPSKLLVFPDETHFVAKPQNAVVWQREFFGWLDKWLK